jgi:hypothetical protein
LQVEAKARIGNYRLRCNDQWKPKSEGSGQAYTTQDMKKDKLIPRHFYDKPFMISFPDGSERKVGFQPDRKSGLIWYTDGSKTNKGTGAGGVLLWNRPEIEFRSWAVQSSIPGRSV